MAKFFSPPTAPTVPMTVKPSHPAHHLFKHYRPMNAGLNLFVVNGVVTTVEPDYEFVKPDRVYLGGHLYTLTDAEATVLTAAGYTVLEGAAAVQDPPLPGNDYDSDYPRIGLGFSAFGTAPFGG